MFSAASARWLPGQPLHACSSEAISSPSFSTKGAPLHRHLKQQQLPHPHAICTSVVRSSIAVHDPHALQAPSAVQQHSQTFSVQRRALVQSILLNFATVSFPNTRAVAAEEASKCVADFTVSDKVFFDIAIDREPVGRIVIGLFNEDVPVGAKRFAEIAVGSRGVSYRKKEFDKITPAYIQNAGVRNFSLSGGLGDAAQFTGGETAEALVPELEGLNRRCQNSTRNIAGMVSIIVKDLAKPPPKPKLVAKDGKFEVIEEELRPDPNGTQFIINTQDSPQLDASNLVVGKVVDGFDVLKIINSVRVVKDNTDSPYFKAAKLVGDTRAVVAERGFYRPYSKIVIVRSGRLES
eukprot:c22956_g1_i1 orf=61-1110(+)